MPAWNLMMTGHVCLIVFAHIHSTWLLWISTQPMRLFFELSSLQGVQLCSKQSVPHGVPNFHFHQCNLPGDLYTSHFCLRGENGIHCWQMAACVWNMLKHCADWIWCSSYIRWLQLLHGDTLWSQRLGIRRIPRKSVWHIWHDHMVTPCYLRGQRANIARFDHCVANSETGHKQSQADDQREDCAPFRLQLHVRCSCITSNLLTCDAPAVWNGLKGGSCQWHIFPHFLH